MPSSFKSTTQRTIMATLAELIFRAKTNELDAANKKLAELDKNTDKAGKGANDLTKDIDKLEASAKSAAVGIDKTSTSADGLSGSINKSTSSLSSFGGAFDVLKGMDGPVGALANKFDGIATAIAGVLGGHKLLSTESSALAQKMETTAVASGSNTAALVAGGAALQSYSSKASAANEKLQAYAQSLAKAQQLQNAYDQAVASGPKRAPAGSDLAVSRAAERAAISAERANAFKILAGDIGTAETAVASFGRVAVTALSATAAAAGVLYLGLETIAMGARAAADEAGEMADKLGLTTYRLAGLTTLANENGTTVTSLQGTYDRLSKSMNKFDDDNERARYAFESLGMTMEDVAGKSETEVAGIIIKNYDELGRTTKATAAVQQLLGGSFRENIPAIREAATALGDYNGRVSKFGAEVTKDLVDAGGKQEKAMTDLKLGWQGLSNEIARNAGTIIESVANMVSSLLNSIRRALAGFRLAREAASTPLAIATAEAAQAQSQMDLYAGRFGKANEAAFAKAKANYDAAHAKIAAIKEASAREFRLGEIASVNETGAAATLKAKSDAAKPPAKGGADKPKDPRLTDAQVYALQEADRQRYYEDLALIDQMIKKESDLFQARIQGYISVADPLQRYRDQMSQLIKDFEAGAITMEVFAANQLVIEENMARQTPVIKEATEQYSNMQRIGETAFNGLEEALVTLTTTGKLSFKGFIQSLLADLARLFIQITVIKPLMAGLTGATSGGSFWGSVMTSLSGGKKMATGTNYVPYDGFNAILHEGEAVIPKKYNPAAGGSSGGGVQIGTIQINVKGGQTNDETAAALRAELMKTMKEVADGRIGEATRYGGILRRGA
jgi:hypothetical protein